jgi:hypothetical protein
MHLHPEKIMRLALTLATAAVASATIGLTPAQAQEAQWTPYFFSDGNFFFVQGGSQVRSGTQQLAVATVPPPGRTSGGREIAYYVVSGTLDCTGWTMSVSSTEFFGLDGSPLEADRTVQPARAITAGSSIGLAADVRCRGKELKGTAITRDRIVLLAQESR